MDFKNEDIKHIAKLARLSLSEAEVTKYAGELSQMLNYVGELGELNTKDVSPMIGAIDHSKAFREDTVKDFQALDAMLSNAPDSEDTSIKIPQMN